MKEYIPKIEKDMPVPMVENELIKATLSQEVISLQEAVNRHMKTDKNLEDMNPEELHSLKQHLRKSTAIMLTIGYGALAAQTAMFSIEVIDGLINGGPNPGTGKIVLQGVFVFAQFLLECLSAKDDQLINAIPDKFDLPPEIMERTSSEN